MKIYCYKVWGVSVCCFDVSVCGYVIVRQSQVQQGTGDKKVEALTCLCF